MKERPILFSTPMVQAILEGRKTQTRRIIKPQPELYDNDMGARICYGSQRHSGPANYLIKDILPRFGCPYGRVGDRLWVRENYNLPKDCDKYKPSIVSECVDIWYAAGGKRNATGGLGWGGVKGKQRPSIHMPRWASRINLEITKIVAERLHDINEEDAVAEGAMYHDGRGIGHSGWRHDYHDVFSTAKNSFFSLWEKINGYESLKANPWVYSLQLKRVE